MNYCGGIGCCVGAGLLYLISKSFKGEAEFLKAIPRINNIKDLSEVIDAACNALVTVSGRVDSDTPIKCKYSDKKGVILEEWVEQPYRIKCIKCDPDRWKDGDSVCKRVREENVPWYLDDGTGQVCVANVRAACGFGLSAASETFERPDHSFLYKIKDECFKCGADLNIKMLESKRTEEVLPVGRSLTVIGEAVKDKKGTICIQKPQKGPFYASPTTIDERIDENLFVERILKCIAGVFAGIGVIMIAEPAVRHIIGRIQIWYLRRSNTRERQRRVAADTRRLSELTARVEPVATAPILDLDNACVVCQEQEYNMVFVPCGHLCCCTSCSSRLTECPLCRRYISEAVRTYRP